MHYEVEKRVNKDLKANFPPQVKLSRIFENITDTYYIFPNPMLRVRYAEQIHPEQRCIQHVCMKEIVNGKIKEQETSVRDSKCLNGIFSQVLGKPKVTIEGNREEYKIGEVTINRDYVYGLGRWTEVEVIAPTLDEIIKANEKVESIFEVLGANKDELVTETYPEILYKQNLKS